MASNEEKVLSNFVTQRVNEGETIENILKQFYKNVRFANSEEEAKQILTMSDNEYTTISNKVVEIKVNNQVVTVVSYSLLAAGYIYVINIDEIKVQNFSDYYKSLKNQSTPQKEFRERLAKECGVAEMTVYRWLSGEIVPEKLKREKISEIIGVPVDQLFPNLPQND